MFLVLSTLPRHAIYDPVTQYSRTFVTVQHALSKLSPRVRDLIPSDRVDTPTGPAETTQQILKTRYSQQMPWLLSIGFLSFLQHVIIITTLYCAFVL